MRMKQLFEFILESILHVLYWDVIDEQDFDWVKFNWGILFVFILVILLGFMYYKAVACIKKLVSQIKKRKH